MLILPADRVCHVRWRAHCSSGALGPPMLETPGLALWTLEQAGFLREVEGVSSFILGPVR